MTKFIFNSDKSSTHTYRADDIIETMIQMGDKLQATHLMRFFKTAPGQYGEGDAFLGLKVPQTRTLVREARLKVPLSEIKFLIQNPWHEVRLCGLLLLVEEMKAALPKKGKDHPEQAAHRAMLADFYLSHAHMANNWDLVDLSCPAILGTWLLYPLPDGGFPSRDVLDRLACSTNLWHQRIAIVSTLSLIREEQFSDTLHISSLLLSHPHDLIHKAVGWMLREVGKRDMDVLRDYLSQNRSHMARTTLRYAIERMNPQERAYWMQRQ